MVRLGPLLIVSLLLGGCGGGFLFDKPGIAFKAVGACAALHDGNRDQVYEDRTVFRYNDQGRVVEQDIDETNDGAVDERVLFIYDDRGRVLRRETRNAANELLEVLRYSYDDVGRILRETIDDGGDGQVDLQTEYSYQENGRLELRRTFRGKSKRPESIERVYRDAGGKELRTEMDWNGDGHIDSVQESRYDASGHVIRWELDNDGDGRIDRLTLFRYDKSGNRLEKKRMDSAGKPLRVTRYYYDKNGNLYGEIEKDLTDGSEIRTFYDYSCWQ
ncbi:MAG: hypothetical protein D6681_13250 [Calditrichaeota bacterium]|nr:MAG: hypothetical protein D6681_13250 [Calditrichota bacterium]